jgi:hypothetical protein
MPAGVVFRTDQAHTDVTGLRQQGCRVGIAQAFAWAEAASRVTSLNIVVPAPHALQTRSHSRVARTERDGNDTFDEILFTPAGIADQAQIGIAPADKVWVIVGKLIYDPSTAGDTVFLRCLADRSVVNLHREISQAWDLLFDVSWWEPI